MALDTAEKRRAASGVMLPLLPGVTPNSDKDVEWRREAGWSYPFDLGGVAGLRAGIGVQFTLTVGRMVSP